MATKSILRVVFVSLVLICMSGCDGPIEPLGPIWHIVEHDIGGTAIWGTSENDAWVVGINSPMYHWDGNAWTAFNVPDEASSERLHAVWGSGPDDYWAGGEIAGGLLHWDGSQWSFTPTPDLFPASDYEKFAVLDIWGSSASDVWAVGDFSKVLHWDGTTWTGFDIGQVDEALYHESFFGISGSSSDNVWMVGTHATILHWNGSSWSRVESGINTAYTLMDVWVFNPGSAWIVGGSGLTLYWNYNHWEEVQGTTGYLEAVWGVPEPYPPEAWATGRGTDMKLYHWANNNPWQSERNPANPRTLHSLWGTSKDNIWAVGDNIIIRYHYWQP